MKKFSFIISFLFMCCFLSAEQPLHYVTTKLFIKINHVWIEQDNGSGIDIYISKNQISIDSDIPQGFYIYQMNDVMEINGHQHFCFLAFDTDGVYCQLRITERDDEHGPYQLYITYENIEYCYSMKEKEIKSNKTNN